MRLVWFAIVWVLAVGCRDASAPPPALGSGSGSESANIAAQKRKAVIARAKTFELPTTHAPPPGDPLTFHAAGFAKTMCSAVFITGLDLDFAAEHVGYFTAPYATRKQLKVAVDTASKRVNVTLPDGSVRSALLTNGQGCVTLPAGSDKLAFTPAPVAPNLPPAATQAWPLGDKLDTPFPATLDKAKIEAVLDAAFAEDAETAAMVITWRGQLIGERYAKGITATTPLESWSMGKSVTGTLIGILVQQGVYALDQAAPIPEWQGAGDPRAKIRIADLMHMSSGLRMIAPQDPESDPDNKSLRWDIDGVMPTYPDHIYFYTGGVEAFAYAAKLPLQWPPNTVGRYRNSDPLLLGYLVKLAVEKRGEDYHAFPQRALFDKIGIRTMVLETDPYGNFLMNGYDLMSARDWARLGNLYLSDGVAPDGTRLLPEGFAKFASTVAPAWAADERPIYGGMFWLNTNEKLLPTDAYFMNGAGGQYTFIVPSRGLVIARLGHFRGERRGLRPAFEHAMALLLAAIPK